MKKPNTPTERRKNHMKYYFGRGLIFNDANTPANTIIDEIDVQRGIPQPRALEQHGRSVAGSADGKVFVGEVGGKHYKQRRSYNTHCAYLLYTLAERQQTEHNQWYYNEIN